MEIRLRKERICKELEAAKAGDIRVEIRLRKARICMELEAAQAEGHSSGDQAQKSKDL